MAARDGGPWGGAVERRVRQDVAKGWPAGLTVLTGDDLHHLDRAWRAILAALVPDPDDPYAATVLGAEAVSAEELAGAARASGMFSSRRVVLLKDVAALHGEPEALVRYAKAPPADSHVLVRAPKLDRKRKLGKALAEAGTCLVFRAANLENPGERRELARALEEIAGERGIALARDAETLLLEVCGSDLLLLTREVEKVAAWLGDDASPRRPVGADAVRPLLAGGALLSGWELSSALLAADRDAALEAARRLVERGDEPIRIVGGLAWRARSLLRAKALADAGAPPREVVAAARAWSQDDALRRGLARYRLDDLLAMPGRLLAADKVLKSRAIDPRAVLEQLVLDLLPEGPEASR